MPTVIGDNEAWRKMGKDRIMEFEDETLAPLVLAAMAVHGGGGHTAGELSLMRHFATMRAKEF